MGADRHSLSHRLIGLIRGINVGRAKRVAMDDLRTLVGDLGYLDVRTVLNSGNVVFTSHDPDTNATAYRIESEVEQRLGVSARVIVLTASELDEVVDRYPLAEVADNPSRSLVAFLTNPADRSKLEPLSDRNWTPERLALGARVAYLWCPDGILVSPLHAAVQRSLGDSVTARNWGTTMKIQAAAHAR